ncbi:tribbles homolog 2-like [Ornithodoros turicata]|uniref:Putative serine/threonine protein kinase n=1 Tax=Ornithodoros turicata TaxID=34597 RepID=A0A2R5LAD9_9ACAR
MNIARLTVDIQAAQEKRQQSFDKTPDGACLPTGSLSPNLQPATPPVFPCTKEPFAASIVGGRYVLLEQQEGSAMYRSVHVNTHEEFSCKVIPNERCRQSLAGHLRLDGQPHINQIEEVLMGETMSYVFFRRSYGDLHSYVRAKRRLREPEALRLFQQIASAVAACHEAGVVLRDLKLRKFVFEDPERTRLKLETLEDAVVLDDPELDQLSDKHGCPAYVSPEILTTTTGGRYSGRAADCWSLGVMLYTLLVGRYPFHDGDPGALFAKIRRGNFSVPESLSARARCLVRSLLRRDPAERLSAEEVLDHQWFRKNSRRDGGTSREDSDQTVPEWCA